MQNYATDADILAGLRNMLVNPNTRAPGYESADAFSVGVVQSDNRVNVQLGRLRPGWWLFQCTDAWLTLRQADSRTGPTTSLDRSYRLGPASMAAVYVETESQLSYLVAGVATGFTVDPTTGLASAATAVPTLSGWWAGLDCPPRDTRSGVLAYDDGSALLADRATIDPGLPLTVYPPGFATRFSVVLSSSATCSTWDGVAGAVTGELPAARSHELLAVDPWVGIQLGVIAATADAWVQWGSV